MSDKTLLQEVSIADETVEIPVSLPVLPVRDTVVLPGMNAPLLVGRPRSLAALKEADDDGYLLVATQYDAEVEDPTPPQLAPVACVARVLRISKRKQGRQALLVGMLRAEIDEVEQWLEEDTQKPLRVRIKPLPETGEPSIERDAARERVVQLAHKLIDLRDDAPPEWKDAISNMPTPGFLADMIICNISMPINERIELLCEADTTRRLWRLTALLEREITIAETYLTLRERDEDLENMDPRRRERLLRQRMRKLQKELGESDGGEREADELGERLENTPLPEDARTLVDRELRRFRALPGHAPDRHLLRDYLEWFAELPWGRESEDQLDLKHSRRVLDEDHHDLEKVKERILEYLAVRKLAPEAKAPILCFIGPPGVGKTSLGRSIARAMGRRFARASLGGVRDEGEIRGHRRTYVGAMPGRILQSLRRTGACNPVFLLDEIDKLGSDFRGDPSSALLEVLDPEQNAHFSDHYLETPFDLSRVLFIATANTAATIPPALLDRMEVIELPGYTERDKLIIAQRHLAPKQLSDHGLTPEQVVVEETALRKIVDEYTREAGVRNLERHLAGVSRKAAARIAEDPSLRPLHIDADFTAKALGPPPHLPETAERTEVPGVAVGLAATAHGGDILFVEATAAPGGKGVRLRITGQLGDVMRESAEAALSWVRANAEALELAAPALKNGEFHLHVPSGAIPKDGPSAGVALVTALTSALSGRCASGTVAMTGEISLRGRVLPVGGIKEKVMAAARAGITRVLLPRRNCKDLVEVPADVLEAIEIVPIESVGEAVAQALEAAPRRGGAEQRPQHAANP